MHRRANSRRQAHLVSQTDSSFETPVKQTPPAQVLSPTPTRTPSSTIPLDSPIYRYNDNYRYDTVSEPAAHASGNPPLSMAAVRSALDHFVAGVRDAVKLDRSVSMMLSDAELRSNFLKSCLVNGICLISVAIFDHLIIPLIHPTHLSPLASSKARKVGFLFDLFWKYPVFAFCLWINASWSHTISQRAVVLQHPTSRQTASMSNGNGSDATSFFNKLLSSLPRLLLILNFTLISFLLRYIPWIGRWLSFIYVCWVNAYYCFDFSFTRRDWSLRMVAQHIDERLAYFFGFGLIPSICCSFGPPLINMAIFSIIYPFFSLQALQARPQPAAAMTDTPGYSPLKSPSNASSYFGTLAPSKGQKFSIPIFALAIRSVDTLQWFESALSRRNVFTGAASGTGYSARRMSERLGKKSF